MGECGERKGKVMNAETRVNDRETTEGTCKTTVQGRDRLYTRMNAL